MLDAKHLRVLLEIVERGTFSAAADALSYTQGAVSQQIAALEQRIGAPVLIRGTKPLQLTEAGRLLSRHAVAIFEQLEAAERELRAVEELRAGRLSVALFPTATVAFGARAVTTFRTIHPGVETRMVDADPPESLAALAAGELDLALIFDYDLVPMALPAGMERSNVMTDPMLLALPAEHRLAYDSRLQLADLADETWIASRNPACVAALETACRRAGFAPQLGHRTDDYSTAKALVASGAGVALVPHLASTSLPEEIVLHPLRGALPIRRIGVVWPSRPASPATEAMLTVLEGLRRAPDGRAAVGA